MEHEMRQLRRGTAAPQGQRPATEPCAKGTRGERGGEGARESSISGRSERAGGVDARGRHDRGRKRKRSDGDGANRRRRRSGGRAGECEHPHHGTQRDSGSTGSGVAADSPAGATAADRVVPGAGAAGAGETQHTCPLVGGADAGRSQLWETDGRGNAHSTSRSARFTFRIAGLHFGVAAGTRIVGSRRSRFVEVAHLGARVPTGIRFDTGDTRGVLVAMADDRGEVGSAGETTRRLRQTPPVSDANRRAGKIYIRGAADGLHPTSSSGRKTVPQPRFLGSEDRRLVTVGARHDKTELSNAQGAHADGRHIHNVADDAAACVGSDRRLAEVLLGLEGLREGPAGSSFRGTGPEHSGRATDTPQYKPSGTQFRLRGGDDGGRPKRSTYLSTTEADETEASTPRDRGRRDIYGRVGSMAAPAGDGLPSGVKYGGHGVSTRHTPQLGKATVVTASAVRATGARMEHGQTRTITDAISRCKGTGNHGSTTGGSEPGRHGDDSISMPIHRQPYGISGRSTQRGVLRSRIERVAGKTPTRPPWQLRRFSHSRPDVGTGSSMGSPMDRLGPLGSYAATTTSAPTDGRRFSLECRRTHPIMEHRGVSRDVPVQRGRARFTPQHSGEQGHPRSSGRVRGIFRAVPHHPGRRHTTDRHQRRIGQHHEHPTCQQAPVQKHHRQHPNDSIRRFHRRLPNRRHGVVYQRPDDGHTPPRRQRLARQVEMVGLGSANLPIRIGMPATATQSNNGGGFICRPDFRSHPTEGHTAALRRSSVGGRPVSVVVAGSKPELTTHGLDLDLPTTSIATAHSRNTDRPRTPSGATDCVDSASPRGAKLVGSTTTPLECRTDTDGATEQVRTARVRDLVETPQSREEGQATDTAELGAVRSQPDDRHHAHQAVKSASHRDVMATIAEESETELVNCTQCGKCYDGNAQCCTAGLNGRCESEDRVCDESDELVLKFFTEPAEQSGDPANEREHESRPINQILDHRDVDGQRQFLMQWQGERASEATWEAIDYLGSKAMSYATKLGNDGVEPVRRTPYPTELGVERVTYIDRARTARKLTGDNVTNWREMYSTPDTYMVPETNRFLQYTRDVPHCHPTEVTREEFLTFIGKLGGGQIKVYTSAVNPLLRMAHKHDGFVTDPDLKMARSIQRRRLTAKRKPLPQVDIRRLWARIHHEIVSAGSIGKIKNGPLAEAIAAQLGTEAGFRGTDKARIPWIPLVRRRPPDATLATCTRFWLHAVNTKELTLTGKEGWSKPVQVDQNPKSTDDVYSTARLGVLLHEWERRIAHLRPTSTIDYYGEPVLAYSWWIGRSSSNRWNFDQTALPAAATINLRASRLLSRAGLSTLQPRFLRHYFASYFKIGLIDHETSSWEHLRLRLRHARLETTKTHYILEDVHVDVRTRWHERSTSSLGSDWSLTVGELMCL